MNSKVIGQRIKDMREKAGLTQAELAEEMDDYVSDSGKTKISNYEKGNNLTLKNLDRLYKTLSHHVSFDEAYLLGCIPHPHITTSLISEIIPLSRDAIESLEYLRTSFTNYGNEDSAWLSEIIDKLIVDIVVSYKENYEGFTKDVEDMLYALEAIANYESGDSNNHNIEYKEYQYAKLAIQATASKIGLFLSNSVITTMRGFVNKDLFDLEDNEEA